jgi:hypothetical protein
VLSAVTELDLEITSTSNPQPSPTMPPLRVSGQIFEMTSNGRVGVGGASIGLDWMGPDSPFITVNADKNGRYTTCGIPAHAPIAFWALKAGYTDSYTWHQFSTDGTLDIELTRR